jgi:acyl-CoA reductase-like NAD-dependent aldehyde dehydrogenase
MISMTIAGEPVAGRDRLPVEDPALGRPFADAPVCTAADLDRAVAAAVGAYPDWAGRPEDQRREHLLGCGAAIASAVDELAGLLTAEQGKPLRDARAEVRLAADWFRHTAALTLPPERLVDEPASHATLHRVPVGPVAAITPSNYPVILSVTKLAPALLAGNPVVLKPSPATPLATLRMGQLIAGALPPGVLNTISGDADLGPALAEHPQVRMISFTGSVRSGRAIAAGAAARFQRVVLELGGNDACVVLPGADIDRFAGEIFRLATVNAGQFCAAIKRVYVPAGHEPALTEALVAAAESVTVGDGREPGTQLGPLVSGAQLAHVQELVAAAEAAGGRVATGGRALPRPGHFYPPTVVTGLPGGTRLEIDEQFGPVIPVIGYADLDQVVARANSTEYGLGGSVWGDPADARTVASRLDCGTVWINTHGELRHDLPFGGLRSSGVGVEYGYWGLLEYTRIKVVHSRERDRQPAPAGRAAG